MSSGNVRSLIKQGNAKLSGKDKAQMLKSMMREKRKVESAVDSRHKAPRHGNPPSSSSHCGLTSGGNASSSIPDGFFDATSVVKSTSSSVANCEYDTSDSNVTPSTTALKSSVPVGFFDDAEADMNARGLDMYKELKKKDESLNKVVDNFFLDVQGNTCVLVGCASMKLFFNC